MKKLINRTYIFPWLIILVFCLLVLFMLSMVYDSEKMSQIWWTVPVGGVMGAIVCNLLEIFKLRISKRILVIGCGCYILGRIVYKEQYSDNLNDHYSNYNIMRIY